MYSTHKFLTETASWILSTKYNTAPTSKAQEPLECCIPTECFWQLAPAYR